jgi:membrane associated rhomboid family serine protease
VDVPQRPGPFPIQATLFSHMFLHGSWTHLLGNMWFLFVFGGYVERALRPGIFLAAYVLCGFGAGLAQVYLDPNSVLPCLGASGAIAGVMGAYLFIHPFSTIRIWIWFLPPFRAPAVLVLGLWLLPQILGAAAAAHPAGLPRAGVAYGAHVGGFVAGLGFMVILWLYLHGTVEGRDADVSPALCQQHPDSLGDFLPQSGKSVAAAKDHYRR